MKKILTFVSPVAVYLVSYGTTFAATANCSAAGLKTFKDIVMNLIIGCILIRAVYLIISFGVVVFIWGVFKFIRSEGDDKQSGREMMFWGIVGIFVMVSLWGLVAILQSTFNIY